MKLNTSLWLTGMTFVLLALVLSGCTPIAPQEERLEANDFGIILVDGSSTVGPITISAAQRFNMTYPNIYIEVNISGSGGGFRKFCLGETDISNASRPINQSEINVCRENGVQFIELPVAFDGIAVVVNPENTAVSCLTTEELNQMWAAESEGRIINWKQVRGDFPEMKLTLVGPGTDSGTYDYFTEAITGEAGVSRMDFYASEDDDQLVSQIL